jgi:hypothetical protein
VHFSKQARYLYPPIHVTVKLYPNPARDTLWLQLGESSLRPTSVTVFDTTGSSRNRYDLPAGEDIASIPVGDLQPGVYFLQMERDADDCMKPFIVMR